MAVPAAIPVAASVLGQIGSTLLQAGAAGDAAREYRKANRAAQVEQKAAYDDVSQMVDPYAQAGYNALEQYQGMPASYVPEAYQFNGTVNQYLDPSMKFQMDEARKQMEASAAAGGPGLRSGAFATGLNDRMQQFAQTDYNNAFNRMQTDKTFTYNDYINRYNQQRTAIQDELGRTKDLLASGQWATGTKASARTGQAANTTNLLGQQGEIAAMQQAVYPTAGANVLQTLTNPNNTMPVLGDLGGGAWNKGMNLPAGVTGSNTSNPGYITYTGNL